MSQNQGVAVGRSFGYFLHRYHARTARFVFYKNAYAQLFSQFRCHATRYNFTRAAWCKRHHDANGLAWPRRLG
jgi:hypothetical protein